MKIKEIQEVKKGAGAVNDLLAAGWELITAVGLDSGMVYIVGNREECGVDNESETLAREVAAKHSSLNPSKKK